jgi:hypothetical protein
MLADIEAPMERIADKHNAAQSEDCPTVGVHEAAQAPDRRNQQRVLRHLTVQTGLHGISPGRCVGKTLAAASGLVFNAHIMPGPRNLACDASHSKRNPAAASRAWALACRPNRVWDGGLF